MKLHCVTCGRAQDGGYCPVCAGCGSLTNPVYELDRVRLRKSDNPFMRFSDLLPIRDKSLLPAEGGPGLAAEILDDILYINPVCRALTPSFIV